MADQFQFKRTTSANWETGNPILAVGEPGYELDTKRLKIGDGVTAWNSLSYIYQNNAEPLIKTGMEIVFAGSTAPTGYLLADGSAVSRTTYSDLFDVIGTTYGTGDGSTTFDLPDRSELTQNWYIKT